MFRVICRMNTKTSSHKIEDEIHRAIRNYLLRLKVHKNSLVADLVNQEIDEKLQTENMLPILNIVSVLKYMTPNVPPLNQLLLKFSRRI